MTELNKIPTKAEEMLIRIRQDAVYTILGPDDYTDEVVDAIISIPGLDDLVFGILLEHEQGINWEYTFSDVGISDRLHGGLTEEMKTGIREVVPNWED